MQNNQKANKMANIFQKIFRPEYQWRILDMIDKYDIKEEVRTFNTDHITPCGHPVFGEGSTRQYSINAEEASIIATRNYDSTLAHPISVDLYVRRERKDGDKRERVHTETDTEFAYKAYNKMLNKYMREREFTW